MTDYKNAFQLFSSMFNTAIKHGRSPVKVYRKNALECHPDKNPCISPEVFKALRNAYEEAVSRRSRVCFIAKSGPDPEKGEIKKERMISSLFPMPYHGDVLQGCGESGITVDMPTSRCIYLKFSTSRTIRPMSGSKRI